MNRFLGVVRSVILDKMAFVLDNASKHKARQLVCHTFPTIISRIETLINSNDDLAKDCDVEDIACRVSRLTPEDLVEVASAVTEIKLFLVDRAASLLNSGRISATDLKHLQRYLNLTLPAMLSGHMKAISRWHKKLRLRCNTTMAEQDQGRRRHILVSMRYINYHLGEIKYHIVVLLRKIRAIL